MLAQAFFQIWFFWKTTGNPAKAVNKTAGPEN